MILDNNKYIHLLIPIFIVLILNYIITKNHNIDKNSLLPSSYYTALIWLGILISLGNAHYLLYKKSKFTFASLYLIVVIVYCVFYPIISQLNKKKSKTMNVIATIITSILLVVVYQESTEAFFYVLPLFVWISFINYSDAIVCSKIYSLPNKHIHKPKIKKNKKNDIPKFVIL